MRSLIRIPGLDSAVGQRTTGEGPFWRASFDPPLLLGAGEWPPGELSLELGFKNEMTPSSARVRRRL